MQTLGSLEEVDEYCQKWLHNRHSIDFEIDGVVVKVDDLAQRRELGRHFSRPPLGHRLQIPPGGKDHAPQGHNGLDRPYREGDAICHARAGGRRRGACRPGHASQRGPGPGQGRTAGRHRRGETGRRRDPRSPRPRPAVAAQGPSTLVVPDDLPHMRDAAPTAGRRSGHILHKRGLPGPAGTAHIAFRLAGGDGHRRPR